MIIKFMLLYCNLLSTVLTFGSLLSIVLESINVLDFISKTTLQVSKDYAN